MSDETQYVRAVCRECDSDATIKGPHGLLTWCEDHAPEEYIDGDGG